MSQISPPIRIVLVAAVGFLAACMLFLRPKDRGGPAACAPAADRSREAAGHHRPSASPARSSQAAANAKADRPTGRRQGARDGEDRGASPRSGHHGATTDARREGRRRQRGVRRVGAGLAPGRRAQGARRRTGRSCSASSTTARRPTTAPTTPQLAEGRPLRRPGLRHAASLQQDVPRYQAITRGVDVEQSPTVVVVDRNFKADSCSIGYVDRDAINQAIVDAMRRSTACL